MENSVHTVEELQTTSSSTTCYGWKYKHYFVIAEVGEKNIRARCKLCVGNKTLSYARNTLKSIYNVHKNVVLEARVVEGRQMTKG